MQNQATSPAPPANQIPREYSQQYLASCIGIPLEAVQQKAAGTSQQTDGDPAAKRIRRNGVSDDTFQESEHENSVSSLSSIVTNLSQENPELRVVSITRCSQEFIDMMTARDEYKRKLAIAERQIAATVSQLANVEREKSAIVLREQQLLQQNTHFRKEAAANDRKFRDAEKLAKEKIDDAAALQLQIYMKDKHINEMKEMLACRPRHYDLGSVINTAQQHRIDELEAKLLKYDNNIKTTTNSMHQNLVEMTEELKNMEKKYKKIKQSSELAQTELAAYKAENGRLTHDLNKVNEEKRAMIEHVDKFREATVEVYHEQQAMVLRPRPPRNDEADKKK